MSLKSKMFLAPCGYGSSRTHDLKNSLRILKNSLRMKIPSVEILKNSLRISLPRLVI